MDGGRGITDDGSDGEGDGGDFHDYKKVDDDE